MNMSWKIVLALLIALTASHSAWGVASGDQIGENYTLGIFGNANMDDTIDEKDVAYVEGVIKGTNAATNLSDANYDGKVDAQDIDQIKKIILEEEKELTVLMDTRPSMGSINITRVPITVQKPVKRIVVTSPYTLSILRALNLETDRIVGVPKNSKEAKDYFPQFNEKTSIGGGNEADFETILSLNPDLVIDSTTKRTEDAKKLPRVTIAALDFWRPSTYVDEVRRLGYILNKKEEASMFIDFYNDVMDKIKERIDKIPVGERPRVYFESGEAYATCAQGSGWHEKSIMAGGNNIFGDLFDYPNVDAEMVMKRNPEIIVKQPKSGSSGSSNPDYFLGANKSELVSARNEILNRSELAEVKAVKTGKVYILNGDVIGATRHFVGIAYMAKWFYPDLFKDMNPQTINQEFLTRFQGLPADFQDKHGIFAYPEPT